MAITIKKVSSKKELKTFIRFNYELYKENPYSVPDLYDDMLNTFSPKKNAAFEFCEAEYFLAYKDNKKTVRDTYCLVKEPNTVDHEKTVIAINNNIPIMTSAKFVQLLQMMKEELMKEEA